MLDGGKHKIWYESAKILKGYSTNFRHNGQSSYEALEEEEEVGENSPDDLIGM